MKYILLTLVFLLFFKGESQPKLSNISTGKCIHSICYYNGNLYAGQGYKTGDGDVLVYDEEDSMFYTSYDGMEESILSLAVYNGKLYAGQGNGPGNGNVLVYDGTTWEICYTGDGRSILSLYVYEEMLYAVDGRSKESNYILVYDGKTWMKTQ